MSFNCAGRAVLTISLLDPVLLLLQPKMKGTVKKSRKNKKECALSLSIILKDDDIGFFINECRGFLLIEWNTTILSYIS